MTRLDQDGLGRICLGVAIAAPEGEVGEGAARERRSGEGEYDPQLHGSQYPDHSFARD
jgi:hypothetical protein